jgi:hypothetical protein
VALRFIFDRVDGSRVRNTVNGLEVVRRCTVYDIPTAVAGMGYKALISIISDTQCPRLHTAFPDPTVPAFLDEHQLVSIEQPKRRAELDLVYRSPPFIAGGTEILWVVQDQSLTNHITTYATAGTDGGTTSILLWYRPNESASTDVRPADAVTQNVGTHKIIPYRGLRVNGRATQQQWSAVRKVIRAASGKINSDNWGTYTRGQWLFLGPTSTTTDNGNTYNIELTFLGDMHGHFPIVVYVDPQTGHIPGDISTEAKLRSGGLPTFGDMFRRNGLGLVSIYEETTFADKFNFNPDTEPTPV